MKAFKKHLKTTHYNETNIPQKIRKVSDCNNWFDDAVPSTSSNKDSCSSSEKFIIKKVSAIDEVKDSFLHFFLKLHNKSHMTSKQIEEIATDFSQNITLLLNNLKNNIIDSVCDEKKLHVSSIIDSYAECLFDFKTEYRLKKYLLSMDILKSPSTFVIQNIVEEVMKKGTPFLVEKVEYGTIMPIEKKIKSYFELDNVLNDTLNYSKELEASYNETGIISNFIQGKIWKERKKQFVNKTVINFNLYYDDFSVNDPLGSHSTNQSIAAFYYNFPTTKPEYLSQTDYIFPAMFVKSKLLKTCNMNNILYKLIEVLKHLETVGIEITINGQSRKFFFVLGLVIGDNLAINTILNFAKGFKHNFFCRLCGQYRVDTQTCCL